MKKHIYISALITFIVALSSCYKYYDINLPDTEQKTVINGILFSDSILPVFITKSMKLGIFEDSTDVNFVDTAIVELYKNNQFAEKLLNKGNGKYLSIDSIEAGENYTVKIKNGEQNFEINCTVPQKQKFTSLECLDYDSINQVYSINIVIDDATGKDYYGFSAYTYMPNIIVDTLGNIVGFNISKVPLYLDPKSNQNLYVYSYELQPFFNGQLIDDDFFSEQTFSTVFNLSNPISGYELDSSMFTIDSITVYFELYKFDNNMFNYLTSSVKYFESTGNPMVEPVNIYSNIEGGIGVIAAASKTTDSLKIPFKNGINNLVK